MSSSSRHSEWFDLPVSLVPACCLTEYGVVQARLQFFDDTPKESRRRGLVDAGDADGADALLSLAALANEAANMPLPPLPELAARELESKLNDLAAQASEPSAVRDRPRRTSKAPPRADVRPFSCKKHCLY